MNPTNPYIESTTVLSDNNRLHNGTVVGGEVLGNTLKANITNGQPNVVHIVRAFMQQVSDPENTSHCHSEESLHSLPVVPLEFACSHEVAVVDTLHIVHTTT